MGRYDVGMSPAVTLGFIVENIGGGEIVVILFLALVVLGPDRIPELARSAGRMINNLKKMGTDMSGDMSSVINDPAMQPIRELGEFAARPRQKLAEYALEAEAEARAKEAADAKAAKAEKSEGAESEGAESEGDGDESETAANEDIATGDTATADPVVKELPPGKNGTATKDSESEEPADGTSKADATEDVKARPDTAEDLDDSPADSSKST